MFSAQVAGGAAAVAAPGADAAGVSHPMTAGPGPEPSIPAEPFDSAVEEQSSAEVGTDPADQIQMPASGASTVQLWFCCWPVPSDLSQSGVHGLGSLRPQTATAPPPPQDGEEITHLGEADGLLVHLYQGPDITDPDGGLRSDIGLRSFHMKAWTSRLESSRDIRGSPVEDILRWVLQTGLRSPEHIAVEILLIVVLAVLFACYTSAVAESKGHATSAWFCGGLFFGPLALLAAVGLPDLKLRKYLRLLAEQHGALSTESPSTPPDGMEDADAQRRRILGVK